MSNYTLDPQFVSEQNKLKKTKTNYRHLKHLHETEGKNGFRYGTAKPMKIYANRDTWLYTQSTNGKLAAAKQQSN